MTVENVWEALKDGKWESKTELRDASGVDEDTLVRVISFFYRWNFIEIKQTQDLLVRRKSNAISPVETFRLLRSVTRERASTGKNHKIAERLACRACGGRRLNFAGQNLVECPVCHERQWYTLERQ